MTSATMELHVSFAGALQTGLDQCAVPVSLENDRATPTDTSPIFILGVEEQVGGGGEVKTKERPKLRRGRKT